MFNVKDFVVGINNIYGITNSSCLCEVVFIYEEYMKVKVIGCDENHNLGKSFLVTTKYFVPISYGEFYTKFPNHYYLNSSKEETEMTTIMNKESNFALTTEERKTLRAEIISLLEEYDYHPTEEGVDTILDEWEKNKGWMIELFKKHPNYNGKFQIVFDSDYNRNINNDELINFAYMISKYANKIKKEEVILGGFTYRETKNIYSRMENIYYNLSSIYNHYITIDNMSVEEYIKEKDRWKKKYEAYREKISKNEFFMDCSEHVYAMDNYEEYSNLKTFAGIVEKYKDHIVDEELAQEINKMYPNTRVAAGQKMSRLVNKICTLVGMNKEPDYNREFAKYSDAINPLAIKRHTILSCHPIDYFTMSFGNSWASCHTIDKENKRNMPDNYSGCYSGGTLSYMLDDSSFVFYTVDKNYNGTSYELQSKINRNMFHIGEDKLIQGRVYPQTTDGENGFYKQIREIVQKTIADCLDSPNMWKNYKGTDECGDMIISEGTHYRDYISYGDCNVSYLKRKSETEEKLNKIKITVGHNPICPCCGGIHREEEYIECEECYNKEKSCCNCGYTTSRNNMHEIDGYWYCEDCCFYCEYHKEWEVGNYAYVVNYGKVCDSGLECGEFHQCDYCNEWYCDEEMIRTEDYHYFCSSRCAEREGYVEVDYGEWYPEDEVYYCENCERSVHKDYWNYKLECCRDCENEIEESEAV